MTTYLAGTEPLVREIVSAAFPSYHGRKFSLARVNDDARFNCRSYWGGGSRTQYVFVRLDTMQATDPVPAQSAFDRPIAGVDAVVLPPGVVLVEHSIFCGKDAGIRISVRASDSAPLLPPASADLTDDAKAVLAITCDEKASYAGEVLEDVA